MKEKCKTTNYPSKNIATQTYHDGDTFVTKHYYDRKDAYVRELIYLTDGIKKIIDEENLINLPKDEYEKLQQSRNI